MTSSLAEAKRALKEGRSIGPSTQAMIVEFNKIIDPNSVVRESEYARTPLGQSYLRRIEGTILRVSQGGVGLTLAELNDIDKAGNALMQGYIDQQLNYAKLAKKQAENVARLSGGLLGQLDTILPPDMLKMLEESEAVQTQESGASDRPVVTSQKQYDALPVGTKYLGEDGKPYVKR